MLLVGSPATGLIRRSIAVDGNVGDWGDVLTDHENVVADAGSFSVPVDPDVPGTADRDLRGVAFTWDATNLYIFFRRTLSGNNSFEFLLYVDRGHDGLLNNTDRVVRLGYNGLAFQAGQVFAYAPLAGGGDAITNDGADEPGGLGALQNNAPVGANSGDGIEFEARIPWSSLGVSAGACMFLHPALSRGLNIPSQVEDNTDRLDTQDVAIRLVQDRTSASASPGVVDHAHRACNDGSCGDTIDLTARSISNWTIDLLSDPNGDGNPADGVLLGTDANGDGDYSDDALGDVLQPAGDTNGNNLVDTGPLGAGACFNYVVRMHVPAGQPAGTMDVQSVRGRSAVRPRELVRNRDEINVGPVVVLPDVDATAFAGDEAWLPHRACNEQAFNDTLLLTSLSQQGWTRSIWSDPNGDGNPTDGAPVTTTGVLGQGACFNLVVRVSVPPGTPAGTIDLVTVTGASQLNAAVKESAVDSVEVMAERFSLAPDWVRDAGPGNTLFLPHVITNHQSRDDSFQLDATTGAVGYVLTLLTDPNGNGEPDDSAVIPNGSIVGPVAGNGGELRFLLRVDVPFAAAIPSSAAITLTLRSQNDTTKTDVATDIVNVKRTLTYSDPLFARPSKVFFTSCATVYVQSHGLQTNKQYRFVWTDPSAAQQRVSPAYSPDARGRADDSFSLPCGVIPGDWQIKLQVKNGGSWLDVPGGSATFSTYDPATTHGDIIRLETDQALYDRDGEDISVESALANDTDADYVDTFADYVIFLDLSGDGAPSAGEPYIRADGSRALWAAGNFTHRTEPIEVLPEDAYEDYFIVQDADFQDQATWCVHERWAQRCTSGGCSEITIDTKLRCFTVSCVPAPVVDAGAAKQACVGDVVSLSDATSTGNVHLWSDGGAGGVFSPSANVLRPTWAAPGAGSYTLTLTSTISLSGCTAADSVSVIINPNPVLDAGANKTTCAGDGRALSDATSNADLHQWSDGGAGGSFSPSATVLRPTYRPPDPSPASITLTLLSTFSGTGCDSADSLTLTVNPNPAVNAGADKTTCAGDGVALSDASSGGDAHQWTDGGAGGVFAPSASVRNPTYTPPDPAPATITLTLTATIVATGCDSVDTLGLAVNANPTITAGADKTTCAGDAVALADAGSNALDNTWSDGGAGGSFAPSASALNPTYRPPDPSPASVTLTLTSRFANGCDSVDSLSLTVSPNPIVSAGADKTTCAGDGIALSDATSNGDTSQWTDGGAGGTFSPTPSMVNPTYVPPDPSPASVTLTLTSTILASGCDSVDSLSLSVSPNPAISAGADKTTCAGGGIALTDASSNGDAHQWTDGGAGGVFAPSATVLHPTYTPPDPSPASITLTLTSTILGSGCDSVDSLLLSVSPNPVITAGADKTTCAGDGIALTDATSNGNAHQWSDGGAGGVFTPSASVLNPTYRPPDPSPASVTLTLTSTILGTGCDSVDALTLTVNPNPVISAGADKTTCAGDGVALADATSNGDLHQWTDGGAGGAFTPSASALNPTYTPPDPAPGSTTLTLLSTITATGCDSVDALTLTVNANPVMSAGADKTTCAGDGIALSDATSNGSVHQWTDGGAGGVFAPSASVLNPSYTPPNPAPASITLTLVSTIPGTGCDSVDALALTVRPDPMVDAGANLSTCAGEPITLSGAVSDGLTHLWSDGGAGGSFAPGADILHPAYTPPDPAPASIVLTLTSSVGACSSADNLTLVVGAKPSVNAGADKATCGGAGVALSDATSNGASLAWSDAGAGGSFSPGPNVLRPTYSNATPGAHVLTLTATQPSGCSRQDSVVVTTNPLPVVNAGADLEGCQNAAVSLSGSSSDANVFAWSSGGAGGSFSPNANVLHPTYTPSAQGTITLTLTATHSGTGCTSSDSLLLTVRPLPVAAFAAPASACEDADACFDDQSIGATSWLWEFGDPDHSTSTEQEPCFRYSQPGTYTVKLTVSNICGSSSVQHSVVVGPKPVAEFTFATQGNKFCKNKNVNFTDQSTNSPTSWQWDFGDGATSSARNPSHAYLTDGVFIVSLVACNACGCSAPHFEAVDIEATCNVNCEANSNQIECGAGLAIQNGNTCTDHDNFNVSSYPCAPDLAFTGENKIYDLNFLAGSNFVLRIVETVPEPNGYDLDIMVSVSCQPPECVAWGDTEVTYADFTPQNDDYWLIVDGRDGSCGPYRLEIECLDPSETPACAPPDFDGVVRASDANPCVPGGILVEWDAAASWGRDELGAPCLTGSYLIWRAPVSDPSDERVVGTARPPATSFVDGNAVPGIAYFYRVDAINDCCGEMAITSVTVTATDLFSAAPVTADAGPARTLTCLEPSATLLGSADGGSGSGYDFSWAPAAGLSNPVISNPTVTQPGTYTLTVTDRGNGCSASDSVQVTGLGPPIVSAGPDETLTCVDTVVTLQGSASGGDGSQGYAFSWTPAAPLSNAAVATPSTATPGTYVVTVLDVASGCSASDSVDVLLSVATPIASAGPDGVITCAQPTFTLSGSASGGDGRDGYDFLWTPAAGLDDDVSPNPVASTDGTWTLVVTDSFSGCVSVSDTVTIARNDVAPLAGAGPDRMLTCTQPVTTLDGSAADGDGSQGYAFAWSPPENVSNPALEDPTTAVPGTYTLTVTAVATGCTDTDVVIVTVDPNLPRADAGPDRELTCLVTSVTLAGAASLGDASQGYAYHWEPAAQVSDPSIAQPTTSTPGSYTLTITTIADGCEASDAMVVADLQRAPAASAGPDRVLTCATTSVTLQGSASGSDGRLGYAFHWEPAAQVSDASVAQPTTSLPGSYTLTITDVYTGCVASDDVVVTQDLAAPVAEAGPGATLTCTLTSVTLQGSASGGNGGAGYSFAWSPAAQVSNPSIAQPTTSVPGTYTLVVTDRANGCTATDQVSIAQDVAAPTASAGPDATLTCALRVVTLQGSASGGNGGAGYGFAWSPAAQVSNPSIAQPTTTVAGSYTLVVTDLANGCTASDVVVVASDVAAPIASAGPDRTLTCTVTSVTLQGSASGGNGGAGYRFSWSPAAGLSDPSIAQPTTSVPGTYTLVVTALANGCTSSDAVVVGLDVAAPVANAGPDRTLTCAAPVATLAGSASGGNGGAGYSFAWAPAADVSDASIAQPTTSVAGTYTLLVTDLANGCTSSDTVVVGSDLAAPIASAGPDRALTCAVSVVTLQGSASGGNGGAGYSFSWSPAALVSNAAIAQPTTSTPGTYTLLVTDLANGCTGTDVVVVVSDRAAPSASAGPDTRITCAAAVATLQGSVSGGNGGAGYDFLWSPTGQVSDPAIAQPTTSTPGLYVLTVTDRANGCTDTDSVVVADARQPPLVSAGPDQQLTCLITQVTLDGGASGADGSMGYSFSWTPAAGLSDPSVAQPTATLPGTYTLTATDIATGCSATDVVVVTQDVRVPIADAGPDVHLDCRTPTRALRGSASGGDGSTGYEFHWLPVAGLSDPSVPAPIVSQAGTYTLTVIDRANGCSDSDDVVVTADFAAPVANAGPDAVIDCRIGGTTLTGSASGGNGSLGYGYRWEPAAAVSNPNAATTQALAAGTFTLTVTDIANGCRAADDAIVTTLTAPPIVDAGPDTRITCAQAIATLAGSASGGDGSLGYQASWTPVAGVADPAALVTTTTVPGTYALVVVDVATGCRAVDVVEVLDGTQPPVVSAGPDQRVDCTTPIVTLQGSAAGGDASLGRSFRWTPAVGLSNPNVATPTTSSAGTWTLTVTDVATGCSASDDVVVSASLAAPVASAGADRVRTCASGGAALLLGSAAGGDGSLGYSFSWTPAAGLDDPSLAQPTASHDGVFTLTVTDLANGCTSTDSVAVTSDLRAPLADAGADAALTCAQPTAALAGSGSGGNGSLGYGHHWEPAGNVTDPDAALTTATAAGVYTLTITDLANGCTATDTVSVSAAPGAPVADAGSDQSLTCTFPSVTLTGRASGGDGSLGYAYHWEPAADVSAPDAPTTTTTIAGSYVLTVTDAATGCTSSDVVVVGGLAPPIADAGQDDTISCADTPATLSGSASGGDGSGGRLFAWSPIAGVADPTAPITTTSIAGTYTLTVTDVASGCQDTDTIDVLPVVVPAPPDPSALDARPSAPPLRVSWADPVARTQLHLTWEDVGAFEYRIYAGSVLNLIPRRGAASYDHARFACGLASADLVAPPPPGRAPVYFLAVAANCDGVESSYGRDSFAVERPDAAAASGQPCP